MLGRLKNVTPPGEVNLKRTNFLKSVSWCFKSLLHMTFRELGA